MDITNLSLEACESLAFRLIEQQKMVERDLSVVATRINFLREETKKVQVATPSNEKKE